MSQTVLKDGQLHVSLTSSVTRSATNSGHRKYKYALFGRRDQAKELTNASDSLGMQHDFKDQSKTWPTWPNS